MATNTPNLNLLRVQETWQFADEAFNKVIDDADNKLVGIAHLGSPKHWSDWEPNTDYEKDDVVRITKTRSHQYYNCIEAGTSGAVEPTNNVTGSVITDGTVTWMVMSLTEAGIDGGTITIWLSGWHYLRGDAVIYGTSLYRCKVDHDADDWNTDYIYWQEILSSIRAWKPLIYYFVDDTVIYNDLIYKCITAHKSAGTFSTTEEANWKLVGDIGGAKDWASGKNYLEGQLVTVNGILYKAKVKHTSGTTFPADIANWEIVYANIRNWGTGEYYPTGAIVSYNNILYKCLLAHTSGTNFNADKINWELYHNPLTVWASNTVYNSGQLVIYTGAEKDSRIYRCLSTHESSATFDLDFDKWRAISSSITEWNYNTAYKSGDIVIYDYKFFECIENHVSNTDTTDTSGIYADIDIINTKWVQIKNDITQIEEWKSECIYENNQLVTYKNRLYRCNIKHKSSVFMDDIAKWDIIYASIPEWVAEEVHKVNDIVTYNNKLYRCKIDNSDTTWNGSKWTFIDTVDTWENNTYYPFHVLVVNDSKLYRCVDAHTSNSNFDETKWEALVGTGGGGSGGGGIGYSQQEVIVLSASTDSPYITNIGIKNNPTHTLPPIDVLKQKEGIYSTESVMEFESGDTAKFSYNHKFIGFNNSSMQIIQKAEYSLSEASVLGGSYIRISEPVDLAVFDNLLGMVVENE